MATKTYYCYSCSEYFTIKSTASKLKEEGVVCPNCDSDDTEYSPEEDIQQASDDNNTDDRLYKNSSSYNTDDVDGLDDLDEYTIDEVDTF